MLILINIGCHDLSCESITVKLITVCSTVIYHGNITVIRKDDDYGDYGVGKHDGSCRARYDA